MRFAMNLFVSSPPSLSLDLVPADADAPECDYAPEFDQPSDDPAFAAEQPGKQTPLTHAYITHSFSLLLALAIAATLLYPILMHSLSL